MAETSQRKSQAWLRDQVAEYERLFPSYARYAVALEQVLKAQAKKIAPLAIVQSRPKAIASFAEKALRSARRHPTRCTRSRTSAARASSAGRRARWRRSAASWRPLRVDVENSTMKGQVDPGWRSRPRRRTASDRASRHRSIHYIAVENGLKAEIQWRTIAEHSWAASATNELQGGVRAACDVAARAGDHRCAARRRRSRLRPDRAGLSSTRHLRLVPERGPAP